MNRIHIITDERDITIQIDVPKASKGQHLVYVNRSIENRNCNWEGEHHFSRY